MLRIAIQAKGRLNEESIGLLAEAGVSIEDSKRKLLARSDGFPLEVLYLRDDDIPQAVSMGVADLGVVGLNEVEEKGFDVEIVPSLARIRQVPGCRWPSRRRSHYDGLSYFEGKRVATSYPVILSRFFREKGIAAETLKSRFGRNRPVGRHGRRDFRHSSARAARSSPTG